MPDCFDGANLWVANWGSNTLTQILASDGVVLGNLPTGLDPTGVVFDLSSELRYRYH
jgi:DNA-binding beta-propeller fold protein YncE